MESLSTTARIYVHLGLFLYHMTEFFVHLSHSHFLHRVQKTQLFQLLLVCSIFPLSFELADFKCNEYIMIWLVVMLNYCSLLVL